MKDVSSINPTVSLGDLGLDSLMGVEVKQCLERADIVLSITEIRALTFAKLADLQGGGAKGGASEVTPASPEKTKRPAINEDAFNR